MIPLWRRRSSWVAAVVALAVVIAIVIAVANLWIGVGASQISIAGWFAMGLGILVTLAVGVGLMTLVFISNRQGYDDPGGDRVDRGE